MANQLNIGLLARSGLCLGGLGTTSHSESSASDSETELKPSKRKVSEKCYKQIMTNPPGATTIPSNHPTPFLFESHDLSPTLFGAKM